MTPSRLTSTSTGLVVLALLGCSSSPPDAELATESDSVATETSTGIGTSSTTNDPGSSSTSSDSSSTDPNDEESSTTAAELGCGAGRVCLGPKPLGWIGPVVVAKSDVDYALPHCVAPYPEEEMIRLEGFADPGPAECECSCAITNGGCSSMYFYAGEASCSSYQSAAGGGCIEYALDNGSLQAYSSYATGTCERVAVENIPEIPWEAVVKSCFGEYSHEACDDTGRVCYDRPTAYYEQEICYMAKGEIPCPPNTDYLERTIRYATVEDTRDCTSCDCDDLGSTCLTEYEYFTTSDCSGSPAGSVSNGTCTAGVTMAAISFDTSTLSCPVASPSEPEGEIQVKDPWTYCCAPF